MAVEDKRNAANSTQSRMEGIAGLASFSRPKVDNEEEKDSILLDQDSNRM